MFHDELAICSMVLLHISMTMPCMYYYVYMRVYDVHTCVISASCMFWTFLWYVRSSHMFYDCPAPLFHCRMTCLYQLLIPLYDINTRVLQVVYVFIVSVLFSVYNYIRMLELWAHARLPYRSIAEQLKYAKGESSILWIVGKQARDSREYWNIGFQVSTMCFVWIVSVYANIIWFVICVYKLCIGLFPGPDLYGFTAVICVL